MSLFSPIYLMRAAPMLRVALGLMMGILLGNLLTAVPLSLLLVVAMGCVVTMALQVLMNKHTGWTFLLPLWVLLFALGWMVALLRVPPDPLPTSANGHRQQLLIELRDTPRYTTRCYKFPARVLARHADGHWHPSRGNMMVYLCRDSVDLPLVYGTRLIVSGYPKQPSDDIGPNHFNYRQYLLRQDIRWQCYAPSGQWWLASAQPEGFSLVRWSKVLQRQLVQRIKSSSLASSEQGVAEAMLLGWRDDLEELTRQHYTQSGITHLLCVSGLHVGILAMLMGTFFSLLGNRRWQRLLKAFVQLVAVWLFVLLTGCGTATLRAAIMFSFLLIGNTFHRQSLSLNNLATSAVLLLFFRPALLFDVGFQLSYAAVLGILLWQRPLQDLLPIPLYVFDRFQPNWRGFLWLSVEKVWQWICLSTAAQLATLPLVLYHFHQFPSYFLIANLTIVPLAGVLLGTMLLLVASVGWQPLGNLVATLLHWELSTVDAITQWVSGLPHAFPQHIYFDLPEAILLTLILLLFTVQLRHPKARLIPLFVALLLLLLLYLGIGLARGM